MDTQSIRGKKEELRAHYKKHVSGNAHDVCTNAWKFICAKKIEKADNLALYIPIKGEVDCTALLEKLKTETYNVCIPSVKSMTDILRFYPYIYGKTKLQKSSMGTWEVEAQEQAIIPSHVWMPVLAFNSNKYRLGYGAGLYDRTVAAYRKTISPKTKFYALAFNSNLENALPIEPHDMPLDAVITETTWIQ